MIDLKLVKNTVITALASNETILNRLVLKGGNAINLAHGISKRASLDVDYSMEGDLDDGQLKIFSSTCEQCLAESFQEIDMTLFDFIFDTRPEVTVDEEWGGYRIEFKLIESIEFEKHKNNERALKTRSKTLSGHKKAFKIDISKFEYCQSKEALDVNDTLVYVYTLEAIIFEKIRALCQNTKEYKSVIPSASIKARSRDFVDLYHCCRRVNDLFSLKNLDLAQKIFSVKKVPNDYINLIENYYDMHKNNFKSVESTYEDNDLKEFDDYFEHLMSIIQQLKVAWNV